MTTPIEIHIAGLDDDGAMVIALADAGFTDALITQDRSGGAGTIELETNEPLEQIVARIERLGLRVIG